MASVDGLISGMSTTDTINQLMKIEAAPQTALKTKVATANKVVSAYQSVNSRLSSVATAAKALGSSDTWGGMKATSTSTAAAVSAKPGATAGSLTFRVDSLATTHTVTYSDADKSVASLSATVLSGDTLKIKLADGTDKDLTFTTDKSLQAVVSKINETSNAAYKASAVQVAPGKYSLQLTAKTSGGASTFPPPTGIDASILGAGNTTIAGANAKLTVGTTTPYSIESATNTFADVLPGVTVTAAKLQAAADPAVTIDVTADAEGIAAKVQALVDNANVALSEIASQSKIKTGEVAAGPLVGDSMMRQLSQDILGTVTGGAAGLGSSGGTASFTEVGVSVDRSGKLTFDKSKFLDAYKADPARTQKFFDSYTEKAGGTAGKFDPGYDTATGLGRKLESLSLIATEGVADPTDSKKPKLGTIQALIQRNNNTIKSLNDQVSEWDNRLELRKTALQKQFSGLEVALGKMQQQSSWLAGQLAGLA
ncbi:flagellar filament capping protein FliD [Actinoplanes sp. NPDC049548]|uniref:flagellar filament capping protein FliD n=1 Tax=Actinoplanes sp. NPDC049548 TaxID=3155152 RepID=UPI003413B324